MNRGIALFVALAALVAHVLAIHNDGEGSFAFPYDQAYVPLRLARNLVFERQMAWTPGMSAFESYPSVLWVLVLALGERIGPTLHLSMNAYVQTIGIVSMLAVVVMCATFRRDRIASLVAPLLLATSGAAAAAAANGLETALFTMFAFAAFLALERGRSVQLALWLSLACLTRPSGALFVGAMLVVRLLGRREDEVEPAPRVKLAAFAGPVVVLAAITVFRYASTGFLTPVAAEAVLEPRADQLREGLSYLRDFVVTTVAPLLLVFPAWHLVRGELSRAGAHAVFLALAWFAGVAVQGRPTQPFFEAVVPALPFLFLGIQEGVIAALDRASAHVRKLVYVALAACLFGSALASKAPGDLGPLHVGLLHEHWMRPSAISRYGYDGTLGRMGLHEEILVTRRLRELGHFLRDHVEPGVRVTTPWPGAAAYLSHQDVHDLLGRADPLRPTDAPRSWSRRERADVVAALRERPEYLVPSCASATYPWPLGDLARSWMDGLDDKRWTAGRLEAIEDQLSAYELVTIPLRDAGAAPRDSSDPFYVLRRRTLDARPQLELVLDDALLRVTMRHRSHPQLCDLRVTFTTDDGRRFALRPNGEIAQKPGIRARTSLLVLDSGARPIDLVRTALPEPPSGARWTEVRAQLVNPQFDDDDPFALASEAAVMSF